MLAAVVQNIEDYMEAEPPEETPEPWLQLRPEGHSWDELGNHWGKKSEGAALKYLPSILEDVFGIFDSAVLGCLLRDFIGNLLPLRLLKQKLQSLTDIVNSKIFQSYECREMLLHTTIPILRELIEKGEEEEACIELLSNILEVLYKAQKRAEEQLMRRSGEERQHREDSELRKVKGHVQMILEQLLRTVNRRVIVLDQEHDLRRFCGGRETVALNLPVYDKDLYSVGSKRVKEAWWGSGGI
ncbi:brain-specific angiogenesis inhibitor 1-associated protein 2-like [Platysternon megacephalum]|uniref:Brain-specific angiogenesis inhibitor 1-associated protein 2-like n=1 Tax=Platysternon megacephalum TaxID=55544 RepID=A0A4D9DNP1_9SAUR|nr:brain-specific angiogenesis inhibitor 1-associated protein 2-like [Platysternon megacephalum]